MTTHGAIRGDTGHGDVLLLNDHPYPGRRRRRAPCPTMLAAAYAALDIFPTHSNTPRGQFPTGCALNRSANRVGLVR